MRNFESHHKDDWRLTWTDKWRKPRKVDLYGFGKPEQKFVEEGVMDLRRQQLFMFFADFFQKHRKNGNKNFQFTPEEEAEYIQKYFSKYFDGASFLRNN